MTVHGEIDISGLAGVKDLQESPGVLRFLYHGDLNKLVSVLAKGNIRDLAVSEPDLEEVFLHYYEEGGEEK